MAHVMQTGPQVYDRSIVVAPARCRHVFTLVELLVVLAIIMLLSALLLTAVRGAIERGRRAQCGNNLKNIHGASVRFAKEDIQQKLPLSGWSLTSTEGKFLYLWIKKDTNILRNSFLGKSLEVFNCPSSAKLTESHYDQGDTFCHLQYFNMNSRSLEGQFAVDGVLVDKNGSNMYTINDNPGDPSYAWNSWRNVGKDPYDDDLRCRTLSDKPDLVLYADFNFEVTKGVWVDTGDPDVTLSNTPHTSGEEPAGGNTIRLDGSQRWQSKSNMKARYSPEAPVTDGIKAHWW